MPVANEIWLEQEPPPAGAPRQVSPVSAHFGIIFLQTSAGTLLPTFGLHEALPAPLGREVVEYVGSMTGSNTSGRMEGVIICGALSQCEDYPPVRDSFSGRSSRERFAQASVAEAKIRIQFEDFCVEPHDSAVVITSPIPTPRVEVYPGFSVTRDEYQRKFDGIDIDYFRKHMKPDVFRSFVKSMGTIRGVKGLPDRSLEEYED